ncbi:preprotein translocase subunit SecG [Brevundimonas sp.]|uniref:preprotein translocase subunit SecG n=1 Tax=Brevundimonas sp. TaxID=1871086 RepID=UPI00286CCE55|nr:preprotein translocase subunit SecG [Brevundimonas sp.]
MLQTILLVAMIIISIALSGVILLQRSEGGALGMGGGPSGFMTARGAGNLLTTTTWWLGALFVICALSLTIVGNMERASRSVVDADAVGSIALDTAPAAGQQTAPAETAPAAPAAPSLDDLEASLPTAGSAPAPAPAQ